MMCFDCNINSICSISRYIFPIFIFRYNMFLFLSLYFIYFSVAFESINNTHAHISGTRTQLVAGPLGFASFGAISDQRRSVSCFEPNYPT